MRAVRIKGTQGAASLELGEAPPPIAGPADLTVGVRAAGLNRADLLQSVGRYPAPPGAPADIPGLEYAGEVIAIGPQVTRFAVGDRVMGIVGGGAFAEQLVCHEREAIAIPERLGFVPAAALPEAYVTAFDALVLQGDLGSGDRVLIHAVGSGVGTAACQLASALGARVIGTARSQSKLDRAVALGLSHPLLIEGEPRFADRVRELTAGDGVDLVLDLVAGSYLPETLAAIAPRGRLLLVGLLGGVKATVPLDVILQRRITVTGTVLRSRPLEEKIAVARAFEHTVGPLLTGARLTPVVDAIFPMREIADAFAALAGNQTFGKIVLEW